MALAIVGWNLYWYLWRVAGELHVHDGFLTYRTPLRYGSVPLAELTSMTPQRLTFGTIYVIRSAQQRGVLLLPGPDLRDFVSSLAAAAPGLAVTFYRWGRA